ncbi:2-oxo acid dehydrogenase subunit E2 [Paenibacillus sp. N1-5-1-14]|uniref:dihydrolipoamide acetyltransferase family protein n=1 Tax=Paenibacillus radicibacter TaxID=2972488 RepID=UPI00215993EA|nr:dihydrolipoamide acetyltransferase family protein [Paenibacillus radicibacter]MCR8642045.1 2-oxo acid dehydrogenase subunit E2 [Paenibacillus radicibacter]
MTSIVRMPQLGETVTEGTVLKWLVAPGDWVNKYEPICEIMTDKVTAEVPSTVSGVVHQLIAAVGATIPVGGVMCEITEQSVTNLEQKTEAERFGDSGQDGGKQYGVRQGETSKVHPFNEGTSEQPTLAQSSVGISQAHIYSPVVLELAREHNLTLSQIQGTGKGGRVTRKDVLGYLEQQSLSKSAPLSQVQQPLASRSSELSSQSMSPSHALISTNNPFSDPIHPSTHPISSNNHTPIAAISNIQASQKTTPLQYYAHPSWMMVEVDVTNLVKFREEKKDYFASREGLKLSYLPFFIRAVVEGLKKYPLLNSTWEGEQLTTGKPIHLSLAVAAHHKLYAPVIRNVDHQSFLGLTQSLHDVVNKVKHHRLNVNESSGGTFTLNNTGAIGSIESQPTLHYPQTAVLSIEMITKRPVVVDSMFAIRSIVNLCLTVDSNAIDPLTSGHFLQSMKQYLENHITDTVLY